MAQLRNSSSKHLAHRALPPAPVRQVRQRSFLDSVWQAVLLISLATAALFLMAVAGAKMLQWKRGWHVGGERRWVMAVLLGSTLPMQVLLLFRRRSGCNILLKHVERAVQPMPFTANPTHQYTRCWPPHWPHPQPILVFLAHNTVEGRESGSTGVMHRDGVRHRCRATARARCNIEVKCVP